MRQDRGIPALVARQKPGYAMEQAFYTSEAVFEADRRAVFGQSWQCAGHVSELPEPGDYLLFEILEESVIVVRDREGALNAFANVCTHRGSRLCLEPRGNVRRFTCPYHAWVFNLDGSLFTARLLDASHDRETLGLHPVALEVFEGLIYVSLSTRPPSFESIRSELGPLIRPFGLERTKVAHRASYPVRANWKLLLENYNECYHCAPAHPEYSRSHVSHLPENRVTPLNAEMADRSAGLGIPTKLLDRVGKLRPEGSEDYAHYRYALFEGFQTGSEDGEPLAPLLGDIQGYDGGASDVYVGVLNPMLVYCDHAVLYRFLPIDRDNVLQEIVWLVREDAVEGRDYQLDRLTWLWDVTTKADKRIVEHNARGVASRYYRPGPLAGMEVYVQRFIEAYQARLLKAEETA